MQLVVRKELTPSTTLTYVHTDKFKTCCLSVNLITALSAETATLSALLPRVLMRGSATYPDMASINAQLDALYGARLVPVVRKKGECHCIGFLADFIDDDFVPKGEKVLEKVCDLVGELLLSPRTHGGLLTGEYVESEKKNLADEIRAGINDKRTYAIERLYELMCAEEAFGVHRLGDLNRVEAITASSLTRHYKGLLPQARVEIFYCGSHEIERVEGAISRALATMPRASKAETVSTDVRIQPVKETPRVFTDKMEVTQGKLSLGFRLGETMLAPNYPALMVFNAVYGGAVTSKLFENVREKLSLCYYASSRIEKHKGIMAVTSGMEFSKFKEAYNEILHQLELMKQGDISDFELTAARRAVITSIKATLDSPIGLEDLCFDYRLAEIAITPDEMAALCDSVTREELTKIAQSTRLDAVYYLAGKENGGDSDAH